MFGVKGHNREKKREKKQFTERKKVLVPHKPNKGTQNIQSIPIIQQNDKQTNLKRLEYAFLQRRCKNGQSSLVTGEIRTLIHCCYQERKMEQQVRR